MLEKCLNLCQNSLYLGDLLVRYSRRHHWTNTFCTLFSHPLQCKLVYSSEFKMFYLFIMICSWQMSVSVFAGSVWQTDWLTCCVQNSSVSLASLCQICRLKFRRRSVLMSLLAMQLTFSVGAHLKRPSVKMSWTCHLLTVLFSMVTHLTHHLR